MVRADTSAAESAVHESDDVRAVPFENPEAERRIEDWIVSRIDGAPDQPPSTAWPGRIEVANSSRPRGDRRTKTTSVEERRGWKRIKVEQRGNVTIVCVRDAQLLGEGPIAELRGELKELCEAGCARIVLSVMNVERISSQFLEILASLDQHCSRSPGGRLKLCKVGPEVSRILELSGLNRQLEVTSDLSAALNGPWPKGAQRVPIEILRELNCQPIPAVDQPNAFGTFALDADEASEWGSPPSIVLVVTREERQLGVLPVPPSGLRIGREAPCEVRVRNRAVSRSHAWIGDREGHLQVEDLGSTNGTTVDGQKLRASSVSVRLGASFEIGPYRFELADASSPIVEDILSEWTAEVEQEPPIPFPSLSDLEDFGTGRTIEDSEGQILRFEAVEGVLVVTPLVAKLDDEERIDAFRNQLDSLIVRQEPYRRIVLNLGPLVVLSGRMIGVLIAYHLRVQRVGGSLRLSQASASVATAMDVVGLPLLIETYATIEDAVLSRWAVEMIARSD